MEGYISKNLLKLKEDNEQLYPQVNDALLKKERRMDFIC